MATWSVPLGKRAPGQAENSPILQCSVSQAVVLRALGTRPWQLWDSPARFFKNQETKQ